MPRTTTIARLLLLVLGMAVYTTVRGEEEQCVDLAGWEDYNFYNCTDYVAFEWCADGGYGEKWLPSFGPFELFADGNDTDASTACCACNPNYSSSGLSELPLLNSTCVSDPSWYDDEGSDCREYAAYQWCANGTYGSGWNKTSWFLDSPEFFNSTGFFSDYADLDGVSARDACCECSTTKCTTVMDNCCIDDTSWEDSEGWTCVDYDNFQLCADGGIGPNWKEEWGTLADAADADGWDASDMCCVCGAPIFSDTTGGGGGGGAAQQEEPLNIVGMLLTFFASFAVMFIIGYVVLIFLPKKKNDAARFVENPGRDANYM